MTLTVKELDAPLGAEISGIDLSRPVAPDEIRSIENAWRERLVVVNVPVAIGDVIDPERLLAIGDAGVEQAKKNGRNRVETVDGAPAIQVRLPSF